MLKVENVTSGYVEGIDILTDVSLEIKEGIITGMIGPNGAGKTTLLRLITGILRPDSGKIRFKGKDITRAKPWDIVNQGIAGTFQVTRPFRRLPIIANVMVASLSPRAMKRGEWVKTIEARAMDALEFVGISDLAREPASCLSHGDLRRLEIARAIATDPEMLLLDEPFSGLNPAETDLLAKSIRRLHKGGRFGRLHSEGPTMIIIEHKLAELMKIVDRVIVLDFGEMIADGKPEEIVKNERVMEACIGKRELTSCS
mgnify:CR=1 FL=1